jgi:hypothetical protein
MHVGLGRIAACTTAHPLYNRFHKHIRHLYSCMYETTMRPNPRCTRRKQQTRGSGGSLDPPVPLLTHLHTVCMAFYERLPTRLNPLAERTCFS